MDILSFFGSVWLAIFAGVFIISMIIGCSFDRHNQESAKWWVFWIGAIAFIGYQFKSGYTDWRGLLDLQIWKFFGIYLAIGLGYSVVEFALEVRRAARRMTERWAYYKKENMKRDGSLSREDAANKFVADNNRSYDTPKIIGVVLNSTPTSDSDLILPKVNRSELAQAIGCWTIFWPFYFVSLIVGDLLMEIARGVAAVLEKLSGRFVRMAFSDAFK